MGIVSLMELWLQVPLPYPSLRWDRAYGLCVGVTIQEVCTR